LALALILPLAAGVFDLSIGYTLGLTSIVVSRLLAETTMSPALAVTIALIVGLLVGIGNGIVVVVFGIDSFIGTLATSSLLGALIIIVSENQTISSERLFGGFSDIARQNIYGVTAPVIYMMILAIIVWYILEHTASGRYLYAIGFGKETARLSGIRTERLRFLTLVFSGTVAGFAGIVLTARVTTGSPTIGPPYLLPAFAAAFVGATQLKAGRFNAWGTVIAVLLIGTGTAGLALSGTPIWAPSVFVGVTLIIAIALTKVQGRRRV
jgi:ribose transport system permease protein